MREATEDLAQWYLENAPSRRERIATALLSGMWSNAEIVKSLATSAVESKQLLVKAALGSADALIAELDKPKAI
jgi:hypothetical protein